MLTEAYLLSKALEEAGLSLEAQHPAIKVPGKSTGPVIRVCLDTAGAIVRCERIVEDNLSGLWGHFDGNHNGFPVIRLAEPLMQLPKANPAPRQHESEGKRLKLSAAERRSALKDKLSQAQPRELSKNTLDLLIRLRSKADELAQTLEGQNEGIVRVCRSYNLAVPAKAKTDVPVPLVEALRQKAIERIAVCDDSELYAFEVLLFTASAQAGGKKAQIALDGDPSKPSVYSSEVRRVVVRAYLRRDNESDPEAAPKGTGVPPPVCAYTGNSDLWTGPFPRVKLPALGKEFYIFSMNSDAECNVRYRHLTDSQAAPIGKRVVLKLQDSLNYIVAEDRKGKTWRSIAGDKPGSFDQLVVYVEGRPDIPVAVAEFLGRGEDTQERQFGVDASAVCEALDGIRKARPGSRLNLFILRKASEGQAFVVLAETPTVEEVLKGAEFWQSAARNVPLGAPTDKYAITLPILNEEKKSERRKPAIPYPGQVAALLCQAWMNKRGGSSDEARVRTNKLRGAAFGEVLDIMLQRPGKAEIAGKHILSLCLNRAGPLLRGLGECQHRQKTEDSKAYGDKERLTALRAVSTIGIALYALESKKEDYMRESAFQIGQVLALADRLHRCYCTVVRNGAMPPTLIGNAVFDAALDNPDKALAMLAERIRVYQGWASTMKPESDEEKKRIAALEAKKVLSLYRRLATKLYEQGLPERCDDVMKAHLLLGYLAGEENEARTEGVDK